MTGLSALLDQHLTSYGRPCISSFNIDDETVYQCDTKCIRVIYVATKHNEVGVTVWKWDQSECISKSATTTMEQLKG